MVVALDKAIKTVKRKYDASGIQDVANRIISKY